MVVAGDGGSTLGRCGGGGRGAVSLSVIRAGVSVAFLGLWTTGRVVVVLVLVLVTVVTLESNALALARTIAESSMLLVRFL